MIQSGASIKESLVSTTKAFSYLHYCGVLKKKKKLDYKFYRLTVGSLVFRNLLNTLVTIYLT